MIILDTEAMKPDPNPAVKEWLNNQAVETLYLSTIVLAELLFGVAALPTGKLIAALKGITDLFGDRVVLFDIPTAQAYAQLMAKVWVAGKVISAADGYIGVMAITNRMMVATLDVQGFEVAGARVINPWQVG